MTNIPADCVRINVVLYFVFEILLLEIKFMINFLQRPITVLFFFILIIQGCASTQQRRNVEESGFLGNSSSLLEEGEDGQALRRYINPNTDWHSYTKVILEPVTIWKDKDTEDVSHEDLQTLANFLHGQLYDALGKDYTIDKHIELDKKESGIRVEYYSNVYNSIFYSAPTISDIPVALSEICTVRFTQSSVKLCWNGIFVPLTAPFWDRGPSASVIASPISTGVPQTFVLLK